MLQIQRFTFNPYQENAFVISDESGACVIIDPGCHTQSEQQTLTAYITENNLRVEKLLNTHGHIDHMLGNAFVKETYGVPFVAHELIVPELAAALTWGPMMGIHPAPSPNPDELVKHGDTVSFGNIVLEVFFTPGHSASHVSFFHRPSQNLFSGDVLFQGSIGRVDLPGGSMEVLMNSIFEHLLPLGDEVNVYCGHGPMTTIGRERSSNPFILSYMS